MTGWQENKLILTTYGVAIWISFLSAGVASMFFFATFDPQVLAQQATFSTELSREAGYTIGFLAFWLLLLINSAVVLAFAATAPKSDSDDED